MVAACAGSRPAGRRHADNGASMDNYVREAHIAREKHVKKSSRKLALNRDTLRNLSTSSLHEAAGGILTTGCQPTVICVISNRYTCALNCTAACPTGFDCTVLC